MRGAGLAGLTGENSRITYKEEAREKIMGRRTAAEEAVREGSLMEWVLRAGR